MFPWLFTMPCYPIDFVLLIIVLRWGLPERKQRGLLKLTVLQLGVPWFSNYFAFFILMCWVCYVFAGIPPMSN